MTDEVIDYFTEQLWAMVCLIVKENTFIITPRKL